MLWNFVQGARHQWKLPEWRRYPWEEALEVGVCACFVLETVLSLLVIGPWPFLRSSGCLCDTVVALLSVMSIVYGLEDVSENKPHGANVDMAVLRFILQPLRVCSASWGALRARRLQREVSDMRVDFGALSSAETSGVSLGQAGTEA